MRVVGGSDTDFWWFESAGRVRQTRGVVALGWRGFRDGVGSCVPATSEDAIRRSSLKYSRRRHRFVCGATCVVQTVPANQ